MSLQKNPFTSASIKEEYLPPPLEKNYLSFFDIQVKMAKEFLTGSEEEKIAIIKKRIKKFFDYGNQDQSQATPSKKNSLTCPCEIDNRKIRDGLIIDCSKVILYGSSLTTYETTEKMFPGFIGFERIDDCNIKLSFAKKQECQKLLIQNSKDQSSILTQHIMNPTNIEWFELQFQAGDQKKEVKKYYARFTTNKDNLLLGNQSYFRKLLGKARSLIDQKESESLKRQKQAEQMTEINKQKAFKRKFIKKSFIQKKYRKSFDSETYYDGYFVEKNNNQFFQHSRELIDYRSKNYNSSFDQRRNSRSRPLPKLDLSNIRPDLIELEHYSHEKRGKNRNQLYFSKEEIGKSNEFDSARQSGLNKFSLREHMIKQYREKQFSNSQTNLKNWNSPNNTDKPYRKRGPY